jgi:uncharacterized protein (DUF983 family)
MFEGWYALHERCPECGTAFLDYESGMWLGAIALGYGIGALIAVVLAAVEVFFGPIQALGLHPMWTIAVIALTATAIGYRWAKAWWFGLLYAYGFMDSRGGEPPSAR